MSKKDDALPPKGQSEAKITHAIGGRTNPKPGQITFQKPLPKKNK